MANLTWGEGNELSGVYETLDCSALLLGSSGCTHRVNVHVGIQLWLEVGRREVGLFGIKMSGNEGKQHV
jgi:hypothetical protein